jgi:hypothetical protein
VGVANYVLHQVIVLSSVHSVGTNDVKLLQLYEVADSPSEDHVFLADKFDDLPRLVNAVWIQQTVLCWFSHCDSSLMSCLDYQ